MPSIVFLTLAILMFGVWAIRNVLVHEGDAHSGQKQSNENDQRWDRKTADTLVGNTQLVRERLFGSAYGRRRVRVLIFPLLPPSSLTGLGGIFFVLRR